MDLKMNFFFSIFFRILNVYGVLQALCFFNLYFDRVAYLQSTNLLKWMLRISHAWGRKWLWNSVFITNIEQYGTEKHRFRSYFTKCYTTWNMQKYGFSLTCILPYKDRIVYSILIRENTGQWKPIFSHILYSATWAIF